MEYRLSFEEGQADLSTINAEINDIIEEEPSTQPNNNIPIKKLSDIFDDCVQNQVNDNSHFKVFLRVRPLVSKGENTVSLVSDNTIVTHAPDNSKRAQYTKKEERHYAFHKVFGPKSQQLEVYNQVAHPLFDKFVQGESCLLFAYGMTNAGKTYTIQGSQDNQGLLPRLIGNCIKSMEGMANATLTLSILEIYQERIFDLLCVDKMRDKLAIRDACGKVDVPKLSIHPLVSVTEAMKLLDSATEKR